MASFQSKGSKSSIKLFTKEFKRTNPEFQKERGQFGLTEGNSKTISGLKEKRGQPNKISKNRLKPVSVSLLSDFKSKISECEQSLKDFGRIIIEAEGSSIPTAINLGLRIKEQHLLSISVLTGLRYFFGAPDSPIREYHNVPSVTITLSNDTQQKTEDNQRANRTC